MVLGFNEFEGQTKKMGYNPSFPQIEERETLFLRNSHKLAIEREEKKKCDFEGKKKKIDRTPRSLSLSLLCLLRFRFPGFGVRFQTGFRRTRVSLVELGFDLFLGNELFLLTRFWLLGIRSRLKQSWVLCWGFFLLYGTIKLAKLELYNHLMLLKLV